MPEPQADVRPAEAAAPAADSTAALANGEAAASAEFIGAATSWPADSSPPAGTLDPSPDIIPSPQHHSELLGDIEVAASVELGKAQLSIGEVLRLVPGSVIHLNKMLGDPVELMIRDRLIARGEVVVVDDRFGLRITELGSSLGAREG